MMTTEKSYLTMNTQELINKLADAYDNNFELDRSDVHFIIKHYAEVNGKDDEFVERIFDLIVG